jgi:hypothetical protein
LETKEQDDNQETLREIQMYQGLRNIISNKLHRVI